ncbi:MAG: hypothetical protein NXI16_05430 [Alphaproteobacteria bacterium]|nr:hypothetical protein [Alphaproteobacteria bacterium]
MADIIQFPSPRLDHKERRDRAIQRIVKSSEEMRETSKSLNESAAELRRQHARLTQSYEMALESEAKIQSTLDEVRLISDRVRKDHEEAMEILDYIEKRVAEDGDEVDFAELDALVAAHKAKNRKSRS